MSGASEVPAIPEDVRKLVDRLRNWSDVAGSELCASSMLPAHIAGVGDKTAGELIKAARCRGSQSHADTIRFIIDVAKVHRTLPEEAA